MREAAELQAVAGYEHTKVLTNNSTRARMSCMLGVSHIHLPHEYRYKYLQAAHYCMNVLLRQNILIHAHPSPKYSPSGSCRTHGRAIEALGVVDAVVEAAGRASLAKQALRVANVALLAQA